MGPDGTVQGIWIANSDPTWALTKVEPAPGHKNDFQSGYRILHQTNGTWTFVSGGSAQVQCVSAVPASVAADFANILGTCPNSQ